MRDISDTFFFLSLFLFLLEKSNCLRVPFHSRNVQFPRNESNRFHLAEDNERKIIIPSNNILRWNGVRDKSMVFVFE